MTHTRFGRHIRRTAARAVALGLLGLALVAIGVWTTRTYWRNFFGGPFRVADAESADLERVRAEGREWVVLRGRATVDTGYRRVEPNAAARETHRYLLAWVGDSTVVVKATATTPSDRVVWRGTLRTPDEREAVLLADIRGHLKGVPVAPLLLDASRRYEAPGRWLGVLGIVAGLGLLGSIWRGARWWLDPETHPLGRQLFAYGPPAEIAAEIESDLTGPSAERFGPVRRRFAERLFAWLEPAHRSAGAVEIGERWLVRPGRLRFVVVRWVDVVWVATAMARPTPGTVRGATWVHARDGRAVRIELDWEDSQALAQRIEERAPWALSDGEFDAPRLWATDRARLIALVDEQRKDPSK